MLLPVLLDGLYEVIAMFKTLLGEPLRADGTRRTAIVMVANEGVMDLMLNFVCSAKRAGIALESLVVFVGQPEYVPLVNSMGAHAIYHRALGEIPREAAGGYGDITFARLMWLKTTSVYVAAAAGFDVLFQDCDLVWIDDPVSVFLLFLLTSLLQYLLEI